MDYKTTVDEWAEDTDDFCHACDDWTDADEHGNCADCGIAYNTVDPFLTPSVAKVYSSPAPSISAHGDVWGRGGSYTWGGVGSATASAWGGWSSSESSSSARMLKHKRHLDSLCKVVDPTVKHTLNFATEGRNYSNMRTGALYVDGTLIKNSDTNLDIVAGLSIHEKLHLVHTQPLVKWQKKYAYDKRLSNAQTDLLHSIGNIIEDEYIESQLAKTHAGYVTYIDKVKEHFFAKQDIATIKGNVIADVLNTLLAMVRFPSTITDERKKRHAKHIQFFARALQNALVDRESTLVAIQSIYEYMYQLVKEEASKRKDTTEEEILERAESRMDELLEGWAEEDIEMNDEHLRQIKDRLIEQERKEAATTDRYSGETALREAIDKSGVKMADYSSQSETISDRLDKAIRDLADSDYSEDMWDSGRALGLRQGTKVTWRNQRSDGGSLYDDTVSKMKSEIGQLKRRIQLYGDTKIHTIRNQRRGKLDKKMLHKIPLGRPDLFKNVIVDEDKPLDVCLLVDESGSMGSWKMDKARQTAIALREALKDNQALNLWVFGHTADGYEWHKEGETNMSVYWSPTYQSDVKAIGSMTARAENRDGMALLASAERVKAESPSMGSNKLMIVISDGEPSANGYRYSTGVPHTKKCVKHLEGQGWSIIQVGISGARERSMAEMFSNYMLVDDTNELPAKISKIIRKVIKV